jgi:hypothetical protein
MLSEHCLSNKSLIVDMVILWWIALWMHNIV